MNVKTVIKSNALFSSLGYTLRQCLYRARMMQFGRTKVERKKVLFYRSGGMYGDNPKAIAEYLHCHRPDIELVWSYSNPRSLETLPSYIKPVLFESRDFFYHLSTSGVWVCSNTLPRGTRKKQGQLYIQTWHGDKFLKKIANDAAADIREYGRRTASRKFCENEMCDYFVTGCEWFVPIAASALDYRGNFLRCGMPRNDCLLNIDMERCRIIKEQLKIPTDVSILIYAPTFRDYEKSSGEIGTNIDLIAILDALEKKYKNKWICLMRAHHGAKVTIHGKDIIDNRFKDVTLYPDMADLLMIADMLISDYSSCGADFAITGRMVLMYQDDIARYTTKGRTLYFTREESPYFTATNMNEAIKIINEVTEEDIKRNSRGILDFYDSFETGHACSEVYRTIINAIGEE